MTIAEINKQINNKRKGWAKYFYDKYCLPSIKEGFSTSYIYDQLVEQGLELKKENFIAILSRFKIKTKKQEIKKKEPLISTPNKIENIVQNKENAIEKTSTNALEALIAKTEKPTSSKKIVGIN